MKYIAGPTTSSLTGSMNRISVSLSIIFIVNNNPSNHSIHQTAQDQIDYIHVGARRVEEVSCLKLVAYDADVHTDFINVRGTGSGCSSSVGRRGGQQFINLQPFDIETGCFRLYTIVHEFLHALGFYHMQSATDRDEYVRIVWDNIQSGTENNFNIFGSDVITHFGVEYDYGSVLVSCIELIKWFKMHRPLFSITAHLVSPSTEARQSCHCRIWMARRWGNAWELVIKILRGSIACTTAKSQRQNRILLQPSLQPHPMPQRPLPRQQPQAHRARLPSSLDSLITL